MKAFVPAVAFMKCMLLTFSIAALAMSGGVASMGANQKRTHSDDPVPHYMLYSWKVEGSYHFAIIPEREWRPFILHFQPTSASIPDVARLEKALANLPKPALVLWSDAESVGLRYPSQHVLDRVKRFAMESRIDLRIEPGIED